MKEVEDDVIKALEDEVGWYQTLAPLLSNSISLLFGVFRSEPGMTASLLSDTGPELHAVHVKSKGCPHQHRSSRPQCRFSSWREAIFVSIQMECCVSLIETAVLADFHDCRDLGLRGTGHSRLRF